MSTTQPHIYTQKHQTHTWIGIGQQTANAQQHLANGQRRRPLVAQNVQAYGAVAVDVRVIDSGGEVDLLFLQVIR